MTVYNRENPCPCTSQNCIEMHAGDPCPLCGSDPNDQPRLAQAEAALADMSDFVLDVKAAPILQDRLLDTLWGISRGAEKLWIKHREILRARYRVRAALAPAALGRGLLVNETAISCTRCGDPITDGYMIGDGDGYGRRFAHPECYREYPGAYKHRAENDRRWLESMSATPEDLKRLGIPDPTPAARRGADEESN